MIVCAQSPIRAMGMDGGLIEKDLNATIVQRLRLKIGTYESNIYPDK